MEESNNVRKSRNSTEYMRNYMREYYNRNPLKSRKYRLSCKTKKDYTISQATLERYKEDIHHIVKIKHLMNELNPDSLTLFLLEHSTLQFEKRVEKEPEITESVETIESVEIIESV